MHENKNWKDYEDSRRPIDVSTLARDLTKLGATAISGDKEPETGFTVSTRRDEEVRDEKSYPDREWVGEATVVSARPKKLIGRGGEASVTKTPDGRTIFKEEVPTLRGGKVVREVVVSPATYGVDSARPASVRVSTARYDRRGRLLKSPTRSRGSFEMRGGKHEYLVGMDRSIDPKSEGFVDRGLHRTANRIARRVTSKVGYPVPGDRLKAKDLPPHNPVPRRAKKHLKKTGERRPVVKAKE